ncbi:MAG TPA: glycoside hydrolase domain-containing protein, partial [Phycisphaerae bacterium]|nr:glycoside hydrolase domain-containing protein [Phycisphaerae bacterium]
AVAVKNRTASPQTCILKIAVTGESAADVLAVAEQRVRLGPGERKELTLKGDKTFAGKRGHARLTCTGSDGKTVYYEQYLPFDGKSSGARAKTAVAMKQQVPLPGEMTLATRFAHIANALEVQADVWFLRRSGQEPAKVRVWVEPKDKPARRVVARDLAHFQKDLALWKFDMPADLPFGKYVAKAEAVSKAGEVVAAAESEFERLDLKDPAVNKPYRARQGNILDWIGTSVGAVTKVPPPWTPVGLDPARPAVSVLGRKIELDGSGLPKRIVSDGQDLLAGPIRYVAVIGGEPVAIEPAGKLAETARDQAGLSASWKGSAAGGGLTLTTTGTVEFDGFIRCTLEISCPRPVPLDALYLDIPIRSEIAERLNLPTSHTMLPEGGGEVWNSKQVVDNELMNTLVSHVWVGNWQCGLTFVADHTRGWYERMGRALQTITREDDAVHLRVYFVQGPTEVAPTSLTFALMPTPTRTRAPGWRSYPKEGHCRYFWIMDWFDDRQYEGTKDWPIWNWDDIPRGRLEKFVLRAHDFDKIRTLGLPYTNPWFAYPWVVPWSMGNGSPVFPIMNEEWANMPSRWGAVRPVASYRDYMCFHYDFYFRLKRYAGFYIDEAYGAEREDINLLNGSGWFDREGNLRGSYHSIDVRELFKRQYVIGMTHSPVGKPFMLNHASWGISPQYMSFVTCGVYVENLPIGAGQSYLDHIPLSNLQFWSGRAWGHFSNFTGIGPDEKARRRCGAALMLHDITGPGQPHSRIRDEFGIANEDVRFFGYWEKPAVAPATGDAIKASVYARPGKCLLVAVNTDTRT